MSEPKPLASLSSSLLARKGGAKPAMRRQGLSLTDASEAGEDDLGWNDMGYDVDPDHDAESGEHVSQFPGNPLQGAIPEALPEVKQQQREIAEKLSAEPAQEVQEPEDIVELEAPESNGVEASPVEAMEPAPVKPLSISTDIAPVVRDRDEPSVEIPATTEPPKPVAKTPAKKVKSRKAKAAFTLRLDAERHLRLRLATTVEGISAQRLVTKAVDEYLKKIPEIEELADRIPARHAG